MGDPALRVWILDKVPVTMEEALQIALNLEALDRSRDTGLKVSTDCAEQSGKEDEKKEKYAMVAAQPGTAPAESSMCLPVSGTVFADDAFCQLKDMLAKCIDQVLWNLGKPSKIRPTISSRQLSPVV